MRKFAIYLVTPAVSVVAGFVTFFPDGKPWLICYGTDQSIGAAMAMGLGATVVSAALIAIDRKLRG